MFCSRLRLFLWVRKRPFLGSAAMATTTSAVSDTTTGCEGSGLAKSISIIHSRIRGTAIERGLRAVTRGTRVAENIGADVVISMGGSACAFQLHVNFSHAHVTDAVKRADGLASSFERCYILLVRPNSDALRNFQLQLSPGCDARILLVASEEDIVPEIERVSEGVLNPTAKANRRAYYKQVHEGLRLDTPRGILAELLKGLGVRQWQQEADLLLDAFGSIRDVVLQPLSTLLADCPVSGETARTLHAFFNQKPDPPLPCAMCPGAAGGCKLLPS